MFSMDDTSPKHLISKIIQPVIQRNWEQLAKKTQQTKPGRFERNQQTMVLA